MRPSSKTYAQTFSSVVINTADSYSLDGPLVEIAVQKAIGFLELNGVRPSTAWSSMQVWVDMDKTASAGWPYNQ
jgi:hypothetical protein